MKNFRPIYFIELLVLLLIFLGLQYVGVHWLLRPEYTYDEGYYVMAARRMLEGDWFLQNHSFDKPFLHPLLLALSATIFGTSFLGYRLLGWLFFSVSFFIFYRALENIFKESSTRTATAPLSDQLVSMFARLIITSFLFLHPVMIGTCATAMGEPFLMLALSLILLRLTQTNSDKQQALFINAFSLAFWIKGSILVWSPFIFVFRWNKEIRQKLAAQRYTLILFLVICVIGLWYGIVGKTKLFVFRYLLDVLFATEGSSKTASSFSGNLFLWTQLLLKEFSVAFFFILLLIFVVTIVKTKKAVGDRSQSVRERLDERVDIKLLLAASFTLLFFVAVALFTKVGVMKHYVLTITPAIAFAMAIIIKIFLNTGGLKKPTAAYPVIIASLIVLLAVPASVAQWKPGTLSPHAYPSVSIDTEIPPGSTLINKIVWWHGSYVANDIQMIEQPIDVRLNRHYGRFTLTPPVFAFDRDILFEGLQYKDKLSQSYCPEWRPVAVPLATLSEEQFKNTFLKTLLADGKLDWNSFALKKRYLQQPSDFLNRFDFTFREASTGVSLTAQLSGRDKVQGEIPTLEMEGDLVLYRGRSLNTMWVSTDTWVMGLRLSRLYWVTQKTDLLPLLLILKKSITIPITAIRIFNDQQRPLLIDINNDKIAIRAFESQNRCGDKISNL